jgi:glycosyltransferase involved in cell wall biosynthesis
MTAPLVSIGLPVYNGAAFLREALDSALAQDYPNFEVVVCDNASTDTTPAICGEYAARDPRIRYERNPRDLGALGNFARTAQQSRGIYFTWLPHDDYLAPSFLSETVAHLEANADATLCSTAIRLVDSGRNLLHTFDFPTLADASGWRAARRCYFDGLWSPELYYNLFGVFRREVLLRVPIGRDRYRGKPVLYLWELPFLARVATLGRIAALPTALRSIRYHPGSLGWSVNREQTYADCRALERHAKCANLRVAASARLPLGEKAELVVASLMSFCRPSRLVAGIGEAVAHVRAVTRQQRQQIIALRRQTAALSSGEG